MHEHLPLVESAHSFTITADSLPKNMDSFRNGRGPEQGDGIDSSGSNTPNTNSKQHTTPGKHFGNY
jgi:hypothetical protein